MKPFFALSLLFLITLNPFFANTKIKQIKQATSHWRSENGLQILNDFRELLSLPNVSTNKANMAANADWIENYLGRRGFLSRRLEVGGAPYIFAERHYPGATKTLLIYAHFDGQPVNPDRWEGSPWQPVLRTDMVENGGQMVDWPKASADIDESWRIFARSAGDDKAPVIALMAAIDALTAAGLQPVVNIKLLLDGEEEFGSPTLAAVLEKYGDLLATDLMLFCDGPMHQSLVYCGHLVYNRHNRKVDGSYLGGEKFRPESEWEICRKPSSSTSQIEQPKDGAGVRCNNSYTDFSSRCVFLFSKRRFKASGESCCSCYL